MTTATACSVSKRRPWAGFRTKSTWTPQRYPYIYYVYTLMQNELGQSPKVVVCPSDDRTANTNFYPSLADEPPVASYPAQTTYGNFNNTNCSYFVGPGANDTYPNATSVANHNMDGTGNCRRHAGSELRLVTAGGDQVRCGRDPEHQRQRDFIDPVTTYSNPSTGLAGWSAKLHSAGNVAGAGNLLLGDGSAQQVTSGNFRLNWLKNAANASSTNNGVTSAHRPHDLPVIVWLRTLNRAAQSVAWMRSMCI